MATAVIVAGYFSDALNVDTAWALGAGVIAAGPAAAAADSPKPDLEKAPSSSAATATTVADSVTLRTRVPRLDPRERSGFVRVSERTSADILEIRVDVESRRVVLVGGASITRARRRRRRGNRDDRCSHH